MQPFVLPGGHRNREAVTQDAEELPMKINQEHSLELLTLLAAIALFQVPTQEHAVEQASETKLATGFAQKISSVDAPSAMRRLDPVALLQDSVPEDWRVHLPVTGSAAPKHLRC